MTFLATGFRRRDKQTLNKSTRIWGSHYYVIPGIGLAPTSPSSCLTIIIIFLFFWLVDDMFVGLLATAVGG